MKQRILLFTKDGDPESISYVASQRSAGHHTSIRSAEHFSGATEKCDVAVIAPNARNLEAIASAYKAKGVLVEILGAKAIPAPVEVTKEIALAGAAETLESQVLELLKEFSVAEVAAKLEITPQKVAYIKRVNK